MPLGLPDRGRRNLGRAEARHSDHEEQRRRRLRTAEARCRSQWMQPRRRHLEARLVPKTTSVAKGSAKERPPPPPPPPRIAPHRLSRRRPPSHAAARPRHRRHPSNFDLSCPFSPLPSSRLLALDASPSDLCFFSPVVGRCLRRRRSRHDPEAIAAAPATPLRRPAEGRPLVVGDGAAARRQTQPSPASGASPFRPPKPNPIGNLSRASNPDLKRLPRGHWQITLRNTAGAALRALSRGCAVCAL